MIYATLGWLYESGFAKGTFIVVPWLYLLYLHLKHYIPDWLKYGEREVEAASHDVPTDYLPPRSRRMKRLTLDVGYFKNPTKLATGFGAVLQEFAERTGFTHWIYFCLYHLKFSLFAALYSKAQTHRQHPDIFDRHRRKYGTKIDPNHLRKVMRNLDLADLAYVSSSREVETDLAAQGYTLLRHHLKVEPGMPAHFLAVNYHSKELLWCIRGTSSITDVITDIVCAPQMHKLVSPLLQDSENPRDWASILFHEGILAGAYQLAKEIQPLLENVFLPRGYSLRIVGHSLGAGVGCCLGILLLSKIKEFQEDHSRIHVYAFGPPNCVGYNAAVAHAPIITSIVNNEDFVTRFSFMNLVHYHNLLLRLEDRFSDWTLFTCLFWWTKSNQAKLAKAVMDYDTVEEMATELNKVDNDFGMYIPGKILYVWKLGYKDSHGGQMEGRETDASHPSLRFIQVAPNMGLDHVTGAYRKDMGQYLQQAFREQADKKGSSSDGGGSSRQLLSKRSYSRRMLPMRPRSIRLVRNPDSIRSLSPKPPSSRGLLASSRNLSPNLGSSLRGLSSNGGSCRGLSPNFRNSRNLLSNQGSSRYLSSNQGSSRYLSSNQGSSRGLLSNQGSSRGLFGSSRSLSPKRPSGSGSRRALMKEAKDGSSGLSIVAN
jgi:hypothetical protein